MRPDLKLVGLVLTCFLVFLIMLFPARAGFALLTSDTVGAFGISGTIWNGNAKLINVGGQQLRNTEWEISLTQFLLGRLGGDFKTRWNNGFAEGFGSISLTGTIRLNETIASIDAASLQAFGAPALGGQISVDISDLKLVDYWPIDIIGRAEIINLASPLMGSGEAARIGNFALEFDSELELDPNVLTGNISDTGGPLELNGTLLIEAPANYTLKTLLRAREDAPPALHRNLEYLASAKEEGWKLFQFAGSL